MDHTITQSAEAAIGGLSRLVRAAQLSSSKQRTRFSLGLTMVLAACYLVPGLLGHDPWKSDEPYYFGLVLSILRSGDWVVPMLAGEPFVEKPPLYYLVAAAFAKLLSPWLALHDAARIASGFFAAVSLLCAGLTARKMWGKGEGRIAALLLLSCLGMVANVHAMLPDNALLGGFAIAFFGLLLARDSRCVGGLLLGTGVGVGFMAKGMFALGVFGLTTLILPILFTEWCTRRFAINVLVACAAVAPWLLLWPIALYLRSPVLFHDWLWVNNIGRFMGFTVPELGAAHERGFWWRTLPWFTFPALPMACYAVIRRRSTALRLAPYQLCMVGFAVTLSVLWVSASARQVYALPLLIPLALAAVPAVRYLGTIGKFWELASAVVFVPLAASLWGVWFFAVAQGAYPEWTWLNRWFPAGYQSDLSRTGYAGALGLTLAVVLLRARAEPPLRALVTWTAGLALVWGLSATLWLPWIDAAKSYRVPFVALRTVIGQAEGCVSSLGLGESERAMLDYVAGVVTERLEQNPRSQCEMLLVETVDQRPAEHFPKSGWRLLWSGARPANSRERFWLFKQEHRQI